MVKTVANQKKSDYRKKPYPGRPATRDPQGSGSRTLATGLAILRDFTKIKGPVTISEVARRSGMSVTRVSRYLGTLARSGFLTQDPATGRFDLGPAILELGGFAIGRFDRLKLASDVMQQLTATTRLVSLLCVWGTNGPTVIRGERGDLDIAIRIREGTNLSTVATSTGRIFLAHQVSSDAPSIFERDLAALNEHLPRDKKMKQQDLDAIRQRVIRAGYARAEGLRNPLLSGIAAPIFASENRLVLSLSLVGLRNSFSATEKSEVVQHLKAAAKSLSGVLATVTN